MNNAPRYCSPRDAFDFAAAFFFTVACSGFFVPDSGTGEDGTAEQNIPDQTVTPEDGVQEGVTP